MFEVRREGPIGQPEDAANVVQPIVGGKGEGIGAVAQVGEPDGIAHNAIELISVNNEELTAISGFVHGFSLHIDAADIETGVIAQGFIVIAGYVNYFCAFAGLA